MNAWINIGKTHLCPAHSRHHARVHCGSGGWCYYYLPVGFSTQHISQSSFLRIKIYQFLFLLFFVHFFSSSFCSSHKLLGEFGQDPFTVPRVVIFLRKNEVASLWVLLWLASFLHHILNKSLTVSGRRRCSFMAARIHLHFLFYYFSHFSWVCENKVINSQVQILILDQKWPLFFPFIP